MSGLLDDGTNLKNANPDGARAMCEGALARSKLHKPVNPHPAGSDDAKSWDAGVVIKAAGKDPEQCAPTGAAAAATAAPAATHSS